VSEPAAEHCIYKDQVRFTRLAHGRPIEKLALAIFFAAWNRRPPPTSFEN
jgi:hypothetical protein